MNFLGISVRRKCCIFPKGSFVPVHCVQYPEFSLEKKKKQEKRIFVISDMYSLQR